MTTPRIDLEARLAEARAHLQPDWDAAREDAALRGVHQRRRRRRALRVTGAALSLLVGAGLAQHLVARPEAPRAPQLAAQAPVQLEGAVAEPVGGAELRTRTGPSGRPVLVLRRGAARIRAAAGPVRVYRVEVAGATLELSGTQFLVEVLAEGARVRAEGEGGRIRWQGEEVVLPPGQARTFPAPGETASPADPASLAESAPPRPAVSAQPPAARAERRRAPRWRALAQDGQYDRAYGVLKQATPGERAEEVDAPGDLLLLADVARLSRHPQEAVAPLRRLLDRHARDPRAPLAAFTLGRILLDDLGRPREAAVAFSQAQRLDPAGPMAQDALAREVESWSRAGEADQARSRAEQYLRLYPEGRRIKSVRRFGGID